MTIVDVALAAATVDLLQERIEFRIQVVALDSQAVPLGEQRVELHAQLRECLLRRLADVRHSISSTRDAGKKAQQVSAFVGTNDVDAPP
ncbi:MAG: hypothetical protein U1F36_07230 [Planctomycetota bacterium]